MTPQLLLTHAAGLRAVRGLEGLRALDVSNCARAGDDALLAWATLTGLTSINLDCCPVTDRCGPSSVVFLDPTHSSS